MLIVKEYKSKLDIKFYSVLISCIVFTNKRFRLFIDHIVTADLGHGILLGLFVKNINIRVCVIKDTQKREGSQLGCLCYSNIRKNRFP